MNKETLQIRIFISFFCGIFGNPVKGEFQHLIFFLFCNFDNICRESEDVLDEDDYLLLQDNNINIQKVGSFIFVFSCQKRK